MADYKDILSGKDEKPANEELINYVENNLSEEEKNALEKQMIDSSFLNDAVEGLEAFNNKDQLNNYVLQLNKNLQKQLAGSKRRRSKKLGSQNFWIFIALVLLLAICILGYVLIHLYHQTPATP